MDRWVLIEHLVDLWLAPEDPSTVTDQLLRTLLAFTGGTRAALFEVRLGRLRLLASKRVDQNDLDHVEAVWASNRTDLEGGRPVLARSGIVQPVIVNGLVGLMFTERTRLVAFTDSRDVQALAQLTRIAGYVLSQQRAQAMEYLSTTTPEEVARDQLFTLLEQHEWNIAKVARVLGVTRPTIYARMERYGLPRRRVTSTKR